MFGHLEFNKQRILSEELDRTPPEVQKKLEQLRNKILWKNKVADNKKSAKMKSN